MTCESAMDRPVEEMALIDTSGLDQLLGALRARGYTPIGPTVGQGAIVYDRIRSIDDLPRGWTEEQDAGTYRLRRRDDEALFGYVVGPNSWKSFLYPSRLTLLRARRTDDGIAYEAPSEETPRYALIGARACELQAISVQDRVFLEGPYVEPDYEARRGGVFIVAVNCGQAGGTCFCVSMKTGPRVQSGFDLALTELLDGGPHRFLVEVGTRRGREVLDEVPHQAAAAGDRQAARDASARAAAQMGRELNTTDIKALLYANLDHPRWNDVAARCLACANCTMVCPTCFCATVHDVSDLAGQTAERHRLWDSCFTADFSEVGGEPVRRSTRSRYRQWMTHKLATWLDQFGTSGCVGCGRCITWCPVGIDITEEAAAIRKTHTAAAEPAT